ncbi:MAG: hypothetical protein A3F33_03380 [Candidatus Woykebacteria bacterium RIFCSPHIGHO2_12_FULL_43_10]|uniref:Uncharacterized protein n=2 Tax=Candidatus Woykeibacteriota TaxID=1817899 RepID=A0A1G1WVX6_9BACT|nr:MAG: hypothetical protein A3J50_01410 [Candidatus Woykebacteria bacterium RIFCSPHIGHO2_02_FULL_43_16b]OGY29567.1 MAG: hypothetical protein A3F33_03380 [Candidatus Woykebacteria bacterium RIFCSPHIGHO2_12_FULL_43_10]OGY31853.1 MAG: hypothetical protein A3A61_02995 [Candidatus Woykebacteria bacterium RIFCSPLOWO2_01_FULL_43_14]
MFSLSSNTGSLLMTKMLVEFVKYKSTGRVSLAPYRTTEVADALTSVTGEVDPLHGIYLEIMNSALERAMAEALEKDAAQRLVEN